MTGYCVVKQAYLAAGLQIECIWRTLMGRHWLGKSMILMSDLLDEPGKIGLGATAVMPD